MIKFTSFDLHNDNGVFIHFYNSPSLIKTAEYSTELRDRLQSLEKQAGKTYVLVNALGSGEFWGANRNGDYFPDLPLHRDHRTFEKLGHAYKHHINKDPNISYGKVKIAVFNPDMHRVELVLELDNQRAKEILDRIEQGEYPAVSMGVKVPYDVCSVCSKKSKKTSDYCDHLKNQLNIILPDGRKIYAINDTDLKFFDISFVRIPADRTAGVLSKVASQAVVIPSAIVAQEALKAAGIKESAITKVVDGTIGAIDNDPKRLIYASQKNLPKEELAEVLDKYALHDILSTFLGMRIIPKPSEFQHMVLVKAGKVKFAEEIEKQGALLMDLDEDPEFPQDVCLENFNDELARKIAHWSPNASLTMPHVMRRVLVKRAEIKETTTLTADPGIMLPKLSPVKNPLVPLVGLGALYIGYNTLMESIGLGGNLAAQGKFEQFLLSKPWLIPILLGAAAAGTVGIQNIMFDKTAAMVRPDFLKRMLISVPSSYIYAGSQEHKVQTGQPITGFGDFVRRHPFLSGALGTVALGQMQKLLKSPGIAKKSEYTPDVVDRLVLGLEPVKLEKLYKDIIDVEKA
jgi:hypothetical protein